mgnify:CR=1 FL=1
MVDRSGQALFRDESGAAEHAVAGERRLKFGGLPLDEFVETMPYNEARRYAKKVLSTMAVYRWLYDGKTTRLSLAAPGVP